MECGTAGAGAREVDAKGQVLSPGFVDTHSHDDGAFLLHPDMAFKLAQGVTTDISGNCGFSTIPNEPGREYMPGDISGPGTMWRDLEGYFEACLAQKPAINNASEKPAIAKVTDQPRLAAISGTVSTGG